MFIAFQTNARTETWEGWRGLEKQACSISDSTVIKWSNLNNVLWKTDLHGEGISSPVVSNDYIIISSANRVYSDIKLGNLLINILIIIVVLVVLYSLYRFITHFKNIVKTKVSTIDILLTFLLFGITLFSFLILHWLYFHENQINSDWKYAYWMFSGALISFLYFITLSKTTSKHLFRLFLALLIIPFVYFLLIKRPFPEYYHIERLFGTQDKVILLLTILAICLPVFSVVFFLVKNIFKLKVKTGDNKISINNLTIKYALSFSFFIFGASGLLLPPLIAILKVYYRKNISDAPAFLSINEILDFSFPYFFIALLIGFFVWYLIESRNNNLLLNTNKWVFPILLCISVCFFALLNYKSNQVFYERAISCYSRNSGELLWQTKGLKGEAVEVSRYNSQATPTPVLSEDKIFAYFGSAGIMCVDFSGNLLWSNKNLPYSGIHGVGASPVKSETNIIICNYMASDPYVVALDFKNGDLRWKNNLTKLEGIHGEHRTPTVFSWNRKEHVLIWSGISNELRFFNAKNGAEVKKHKLKIRRGGQNVVSPIISGDTLFLANKLGLHALSLENIFSDKPSIIWSINLKAKGPDTSCPVKVKNKIFMVTDNGRATCVDSRDGKIIWQEKFAGVFYASLIADDKHVYFTDTKSKITIVKNSADFEVVGINELNEHSNSTPVVVDNKVIMRTSNALWCFSN